MEDFNKDRLIEFLKQDHLTMNDITCNPDVFYVMVKAMKVSTGSIDVSDKYDEEAIGEIIKELEAPKYEIIRNYKMGQKEPVADDKDFVKLYTDYAIGITNLLDMMGLL